MRNTILIALMLAFGLGLTANPHMWSGTSPGKFWNNWAINLNGGYTSYFGDLSIYDSDILNKIKFESKPAIGFSLTKYITDDIGISGQLLYGGLKSQYTDNLFFETNFFEYNFQLRVDLLNLFVKKNNTGIGVIAFGGIGHFMFNAVKYQYKEGRLNEYPHKTRTPEFVYFLGGGLEYSISNRFSINIDAALKQANNDRIDNEVRQNNNDFYSYISVGVTYHIFQLFGKSNKGGLHRPGVKMAYR